MIIFRIHQGRLEASGAHPGDREGLIALRDLWEERAAILEHQAGLSREEAERRALADCGTFWPGRAPPVSSASQPDTDLNSNKFQKGNCHGFHTS